MEQIALESVPMEQKSTKINPCVYGQLIFDKGAKNTQ